MINVPLKYVTKVNRYSLTGTTDPDYRFLYCDVSSVERGNLTIPDATLRFADAPSRARRIAKSGDIVMSTVRPYLKAVAQVPDSEDSLIFSTGFAVLTPAQEKVDSRYLYWVLQSDPLVAEATRWSNGVSYPAINVDDLMRIKLSLPTLQVQMRIADFLGTETAKIDRLIAKQCELMDLLRLRNEAKWHAAFTGFTPVKTRPLKRLLVKLRRPVLEGSGVVTAFRDGEVTLRSNRREEGFTFSETETGYQGVAVGDLVFHGLDGFAGAVGISDSDGQSTPVYHVCRLRDDEDNLRFIAYLLRYLGHSGFLATQAPSVRQRAVDFRNWQTFGQVPLSLPDPEEQERIVTELDENAVEFLNTKTTIEKAIELLQERRSALITAAVTGQIEV
ncbi:restriction endonuclease subunit S [Rothia mucilaginosa]|uniref:restriction endonuclease subunit S n=1 Tax=Rothia mucilaginosa TaxID=43675 RepID=UPI0009B9B439|nr:restriction endonuclease subunit S [Rothia mucilaginosa]